jgi:ABC-2 type transport system permease protein
MSIAGLVIEGTGLAVVWTMLSRFNTIRGWTFSEMLYLYGFLMLTSSFTTLVFSFSPGFQWVVREGQFDRYLVRPLPPLVQLMTSRLHVPNVGPFLGGVIIFIAANTLVRIDWSPATGLYLILALIGSCLLQAAFNLVIAGLTFRLLSTNVLFNLVSNLFRFTYYPLTIFTSPLRFFLTFILPFAFMGYLPATVLLNRTGEISIPVIFAYLAPLAGIILVVPGYWFFSRQIRYYQSAGH